MKQLDNYSIKIERDGHTWAFTVRTPDGQIAVREGGFFVRDAAVAQAQETIRDLKAFTPD